MKTGYRSTIGGNRVAQNDPPFAPMRRLLLQGAVAGALGTAVRARAQSEEGEAKEDTAPISPLMMTLATYIAETANRPLPDNVVEFTKHHFLDTLAAMVSGTRLVPGQRALAFVKTLGGTREACVPGSRVVTNAINAAFAGGMLGHADESDDNHAASMIHPGCGVVPAALAMAEREKAGGTALLRAVALGYDVAVRMGLALGAHTYDEAGRDTHAPGNTFGAAAAAGSLARLNVDQVRHLLNYAAQQASGVSNFFAEPEHVSKAFNFGGMPARNGVTAALLAEAGWTGYKDVFSSDRNYFGAFGITKSNPEILVGGLGERYEVVGTNIKRWSAGGPVQAPLDSMSALVKEYKLKPGDVEKVVVRISHQGVEITNNRDMANICLQHLIAVMLIDGTVTLESANDQKRMQDPKVLEVRRRVELVGDDEMDRLFPVRQAIVEIRLRDGRDLRHRTTVVRGMAKNPMNREEVAEKCYGLCAPVLGKQKTRGLIDAVWRLDNTKDVRTLRPLLMV